MIKQGFELRNWVQVSKLGWPGDPEAVKDAKLLISLKVREVKQMFLYGSSKLHCRMSYSMNFVSLKPLQYDFEFDSELDTSLSDCRA